MKRIIVAVALIATASNVVAGPMCMAFHTSPKSKKAVAPAATSVASKEDAKVKAEIEARIAAVTKGASQVEASEVKQEVKKPGFFSRLYRGARRHTKKVAFGVAALVTSVAGLALDDKGMKETVFGKNIPGQETVNQYAGKQHARKFANKYVSEKIIAKAS